jgi:predicted ribosomally synthesized peptide with SipW-like signal peptide
MTDDTFELSRRKALAGLGTIGLASAGAGMGTSAFFSDEEVFTANSLTAGELDLKVDWEEHYSDWSADEEQFGGMAGPDETADYTLPAPDDDPNASDIRLVFSDQDAFWDATSIEAFPDRLGPDEEYDGIQAEIPEGEECTVLGDLDGVLSAPRRTRGTVKGQTTNPGDPVINISDIKPGDFGEVTYSLHLCGNPGYVWVNGEVTENAENGITEPEGADPDENGGEPGELLDAIQARLFYDENGNNQFDGAMENPACIAFVLDDSGSMSGAKATNTRNAANALIDSLDDIQAPDDDISPHEATVVTFGSVETLQQPLTTDASDLKDGVNEVDGDAGQTNIAAAIEEAGDQLAECSNPDAQKIMVILSNGAENIGDASGAADTVVANGNVDTFFTIGVQAGPGGDSLLQNIAGKSPSGNGEFFDVGDPGGIAAAFGALTVSLTGDTVIEEGSLGDVLNALNADPENGDWGVPLDGNRTTEERECFINSTTQWIALEWWLPVDHANEIQTDSVAFDIGFYTEQCRHNDGSGMPAENGNGNGGNGGTTS